MEKIEVYYKPVLILGYHKSLVYTDSDGVRHVVRAGPLESELPPVLDAMFLMEHGINPYSVLVSRYGIYDDQWIDYQQEGTHPIEPIAEKDTLKAEWDKIIQSFQEFNNYQYQYHPTLQSCNTMVDIALENAALPLPQDDGLDKYWCPGSRGKLRRGRNNWPPLSTTLPKQFAIQSKIEALRVTKSEEPQ